MSYCDIPHGDIFEQRLLVLLNDAYKPLSMQASMLTTVMNSHGCEATSRLLVDVMRAAGCPLTVATKITHSAARENFTLVDLYSDPDAQVQGCWVVDCNISVNYERDVFCVGHREGVHYFAMEFDKAVAVYAYDHSEPFPEMRNIGLVNADLSKSPDGFSKGTTEAAIWAANRFKLLNLAHATPRVQKA